MALLLPVPNRTAPSYLKNGDDGWPVYGLQCALNAVTHHTLTLDGDFGPATERAVRSAQDSFHLSVDGVAGSVTQARLVAAIDAQVDARHDLPTGLLRGFADSEGGNNLGAVNWSVGGGVDCGVVQIRCYGPPFKMEELLTSYDPNVAMDRLAVTFRGLVDSFRTLGYAGRHKVEYAQRCAAMSWNWPVAARQLAVKGRLTFPDRDATWAVVNGQRIRFSDGTPVRTWEDWCEFYAMGGPHGEGRVTRFVKW